MTVDGQHRADADAEARYTCRDPLRRLRVLTGPLVDNAVLVRLSKVALRDLFCQLRHQGREPRRGGNRFVPTAAQFRNRQPDLRLQRAGDGPDAFSARVDDDEMDRDGVLKDLLLKVLIVSIQS